MLEPAIEAWKYLIRITGIPIDPGPAALATVAIFVSGKALWAMRRSRRDFERIARELERSTAAISGHMKVEFDAQVDKMGKIQSSVQRTLNRKFRGVEDKFEALQTLLRPTEAVASVAVDEEMNADRDENGADRGQAKNRLQLAESVRSAVVEKWLGGMIFQRSERDPNIYVFSGHSDGGNDYRIMLHTPYRECLGSDGRMPFAMDVWMNGRKHLNFEWDSDGKYALRGFRRGEWIEDVAMWRLQVGAAQQAAA